MRYTLLVILFLSFFKVHAQSVNFTSIVKLSTGGNYVRNITLLTGSDTSKALVYFTSPQFKRPLKFNSIKDTVINGLQASVGAFETDPNKYVIIASNDFDYLVLAKPDNSSLEYFKIDSKIVIDFINSKRIVSHPVTSDQVLTVVKLLALFL